ncbi:MAG: hypothetical protein JW818_02530 [Pirellulales bacterium]|nr:hypothetical protein [Pirellulales bacterium]
MIEQDVIEKGVSEVHLNSWREFIPLVESIRDNTFVYRGQADARWKIESTLDRYERRFPTSPNTSSAIPESFDCPPVLRNVHLEAFKESVRG